MSKFELKSNKSREYKSKTFRLPADLLNDLEQRAQEKELLKSGCYPVLRIRRQSYGQ